MNPIINFVAIEHNVISAMYLNLTTGAKVVLVDKTSGQQMPDPVTEITSPEGSLSIRLPETFAPGAYYLKALDAQGKYAAQSVEFYVS
jgi:hypothetical protein